VDCSQGRLPLPGKGRLCSPCCTCFRSRTSVRLRKKWCRLRLLARRGAARAFPVPSGELRRPGHARGGGCRRRLVSPRFPNPSPPPPLPPTQADLLEKEDLDKRLAGLEALEKLQEAGPVYDVVAFHDGTQWRAALDSSEVTGACPRGACPRCVGGGKARGSVHRAGGACPAPRSWGFAAVPQALPC
jgi:hypothetical protein